MAEPNPTMLDPNDDDFDYTKEPEPDTTEETTENSSADEFIPDDSLRQGVVTETADDHALLELDEDETGVLPYQELKEGSVSVGDEMWVKVLPREEEDGDVSSEGEDSPLQLSERQAVDDLVWSRIEHAMEVNATVEGTIFKKIKGGFLVKLFGSLTAFMPQSHLSLSPKKNYEKYIDRSFEMRILEYDRDDDNVVVSRREQLEEARKKQQSKFFAEIEEGEWVEGTVKNIVDFGAFINLGPVDGLLHKSDVAWGSVRDVNNHLKMGEEVEVKILDYDEEEAKVSLGLKQKYPDPWKDIHEKYEEDQVTEGEVVDVWSDGIFVRLERDVEGKVPEDELSWTRTWDHPRDEFRQGRKVEVKILEIDEENRRIYLSHKQTEPNPWEILQKRFPEGTVLSAPVVDISKDTLKVQLLKNVKGIIRKEEIRWEDENIDLFEQFDIGQKVESKVLKMDSDSQRVELGVKQTLPDPWVQKAREFPPGTTMEGKITNVLQFGAFVQLGDGVEGLVHVSEMSANKRVNPFEEVDEGDTVGVKVLNIDEDDHKIDLSMSAYEEEKQREEMEKYMEKKEDNSSGGNDMTMGDLLGDDLDKMM